MQHSWIRRIAFFIALYCVGQTIRAEDYWTYKYQDFDLTVAGSREAAVSLAHTIARFHEALAQILPLPSAPIPTHIYMLEPAQAAQITGMMHSALYHLDSSEAFVIGDMGTGPERYWAALFGYTGSVLAGGWARRYPIWWKVGVPQLFAHSEFELDKVKTGGHVYGSLPDPFIPTRTLFRTNPGDPRLQDKRYQERFDAESWFIARQIYVQGKLRPEFTRYLSLLQEGKDEAGAFAESFKISYEDLDRLLQQVIGDISHIYVIKIQPLPPDSGEPRKLTSAEKVQLKASLATRFGR